MPESIYNLKIFDGIQKEIVSHIVDGCKTKEFHNEEIILMEWDASNWEWYIIKNWEVAVSVNWNRIVNLSQWDIFWEIALLSDEKRNATITAITDLEVIVLTLDDLVEMINNDENRINKMIISRIEQNLDMQ